MQMRQKLNAKLCETEKGNPRTIPCADKDDYVEKMLLKAKKNHPVLVNQMCTHDAADVVLLLLLLLSVPEKDY